jgi:alkylhydroperoxidase family enzyme
MSASIRQPDTPLPATVDEPFLKPIDKPRGMILRLLYRMSRKQFGKVMMPFRVFVARMPLAFGQFIGKVAQLDKKLVLPRETVMLLRERVAQINVCLFCIDIGRWFTIQASMNQAKFDALDEYHTSPLFTEKERAALDYVTELTRDKKIAPETFARLAVHYSEREICDIVWIAASEHVYNITNIGLNIHSDLLCDLTRARKSA